MQGSVEYVVICHVFVSPLGEHVHSSSPSGATPVSENKEPPKVARVCGLQTHLYLSKTQKLTSTSVQSLTEFLCFCLYTPLQWISNKTIKI